MKKRAWFVRLAAGTIVVAIVGVVSLQGCSSVREVSAPRFLELANLPVGSMTSTHLIGATRQRAYLEYWRMPILFGSGITVYWTRLDDLPEEVGSELKAGRNPWKPPEE